MFADLKTKPHRNILEFNPLRVVLCHPKTRQHLKRKLMPTSQPLTALQMGNENSPTVLRFGDGVGAALAVILGHIFTLLEGGSLVLQNVSDTESVAVKSPLLAQFGAI